MCMWDTIVWWATAASSPIAYRWAVRSRSTTGRFWAAIAQFSRIGAHVMVSGGSLISKDIPPFVTAAHNPLSFVGINSIGLRRRDFTNEQIEQIQEMCRILFQSGYSYTKGCELVEREMPQGPERDMMLSFIRNSKRGIIKPYNPRKKNEDIG